jgi:hypothetical protein
VTPYIDDLWRTPCSLNDLVDGMNRRAASRCLFLLIALAAHRAEAVQPRFINYVVLPVQTEVEKSILGSVDLFVEVHGNSILDNEKFKTDGIDATAFENQLRALQSASVPESIVLIQIYLSRVLPGDKAKQALNDGITQIRKA